MSLTPETIEQAKMMRKKLHYSLRHIAVKLKADPEELRRALDMRCFFTPDEASPQALADREHRFRLRHTTITGFVLGDPLPGYSALDRGNEQNIGR